MDGVGSGGEGHGLGGLAVEHPPPLEGHHDQHSSFRGPSGAMQPTEFPARGFSKNPVLFEATSFFVDRWIDAHDDDGGVLACVLPFPHLPAVVVLSSRNSSLWWRADSRRRRIASSSGDRGLRGLGTMVLDSEIDWELVDLEADTFVPSAQL